MGINSPEDRTSFRSSPAKLAQHHSSPRPTLWTKISSFSPAILFAVGLVLIMIRLYYVSNDVVSQLRGTTEDGKAVVSFRFDDDFESLTEERKAAYLDEIAKAIGVEYVDLKGFRKGSVIVDINTGQETAERVSRDSQSIGQSLKAEVSIDGLNEGSSGNQAAGHNPFKSGFRLGVLYGMDGEDREDQEIVLKSGDHVETDRGLFALAKVSGMLFHDRNANGILDFGDEEGIEGVKVLFVRGSDGEVISEMVSDRNGQYHFSEKEPGDYFVSIQLESGHLISPLPDSLLLTEYQTKASFTRSRVIKSDFEPSRGGNSSIFALHSGSRSNELNAALYKPSQIRGFAWEDVRGEGVFKGQQAVSLGAEPRSLGSNAMADLILQSDPEQPIVASVALVANGAFVFDNVMPGSYKLKYSLPSDHYFVRSSLVQSPFNIGSGEARQVDVGFYRPITVTGSIFEDLNAVGFITGKENEARRHIRGARIELVAESTETRESNKYLQEHSRSVSPAVITSTSGAFKFEGFAPGVYHLHFTPPEGYKRSIKLTPTDLAKIRTEDPEALASDADQKSGLTSSYLIPSGSHLKKADGSDITVCMYTLATLGGFIWEDRNADGIFDDDERALPNVEVRLSNHDHTFQRSTFTNERGHYLFKNLEPGRYLNPVIIPPLNHQLSNARITFKYVDASDRRLYD